jgi:hypothetical protein
LVASTQPAASHAEIYRLTFGGSLCCGWLLIYV